MLQALAQVVADQLGGRCSYAELSHRYAPVAAALKARRDSIALPIGALSVGLARHRALLFKALADASELPCRLLRGKFYLGTRSCLFGAPTGHWSTCKMCVRFAVFCTTA